jgi:hypothetical protein
MKDFGKAAKIIKYMKVFQRNDMNNFKTYLLNEDRAFLGQKVNKILTAAHDIEADMEHMGSRQIIRLCDDIVNQIRKILHNQWSPSQRKHLIPLQKIAVAIKKTIEDKGNLRELIPSAIEELELVSSKLGTKNKESNILDQAAELEGEDVTQKDMEVTPKDQDNADSTNFTNNGAGV